MAARPGRSGVLDLREQSTVENETAWRTDGHRRYKLDPSGPADGLYTGGLPIAYRGNNLPYGTALIASEFGCLSAESGVTCAYLTTGSGFFLSREQYNTI